MLLVTFRAVLIVGLLYMCQRVSVTKKCMTRHVYFLTVDYKYWMHEFIKPFLIEPLPQSDHLLN